jgi:hypothetical protein
MFWIFKNYKAAMAIASLILTGILTPGIIFIFNFFIDSRTSMATVKAHDFRIMQLEQSGYENAAYLKDIKSSLIRIEDREYQELKQARQFRQGQK